MTHPAPSSPRPQPQRGQQQGDRAWRFWPLLPIYPYGYRQTLCAEVVPDTIWTFDQLQGIFYVIVPIRMTVVRLAAGGLLVYAPVAPTAECVAQMRQLEQRHGTVKYIILPTVSGLEHKVYVGPFARQFPTAQVYVAPHQWSFPVNLPLSWLGLPGKRTHRLPDRETLKHGITPDSPPPFLAQLLKEFDYAQLGPVELGVAPFEEVALLHRASRTLLLTDSIVSIPTTPPAILNHDPYPMLFHARETGRDPIYDTPENRVKGWQRIALYAMYFVPGAIDVPPLGELLRDARQGGDRSRQGYFGLYPFRWAEDWQRSFDALSGNGRLLVAPVLQKLIFNRDPNGVLQWADRVAQWDFQRIIPCHFDAPIVATPQQFRRAFQFLEDPERGSDRHPDNLLANDLYNMERLDNSLSRLGINRPAQKQ